VALAGRYVGVVILMCYGTFYGWEKPSPIQEASIPVALAGRYVGVVIRMRYLIWLLLSWVIGLI
jgi:predicted cobalt transporter CbtA